ncbi:DEAD/DEAH box helicase [Allosalinactinospora lopnorensis]|uniref:DEAD/DEAH box helicase n=1 Tax=Allosalinactinospora lopnorensis TaxID=1352348 RepID=UPI001F446FE0|nr:DEAD/DEAH box helicase [Allosalinactinospora lopnorensis]
MTRNTTDGTIGFADLPLRPELLGALSDLGYEEPTPIQLEAIPPLLEGRDLLGQAATGTGKTAAFALPVLQRLSQDGAGAKPMALILVPTRELAVQVSEAVHRYGRDLGARVLPIYGGQPIGRQLRGLERGTDVVVATPGRALDHMSRGTLSLDGLTMTVLDEADEMLDMGFAEDIERSSRTPPRTARKCSSRRRCPRAWTGWSAATCATRPGSRSRARRRPRARLRWCGRTPMWSRGPTSPRRSDACWTPSPRPPRSSSAAHARRSTTSPRP